MDADAGLAVGDEKPWIEHRIHRIVKAIVEVWTLERDKMRLSVGVDPRVKACVKAYSYRQMLWLKTK